MLRVPAQENRGGQARALWQLLEQHRCSQGKKATSFPLFKDVATGEPSHASENLFTERFCGCVQATRKGRSVIIPHLSV